MLVVLGALVDYQTSVPNATTPSAPRLRCRRTPVLGPVPAGLPDEVSFLV